jgi:hypothetical protein
MEMGNEVTAQQPADQAEQQGQKVPTSKAGRPPPIVLTSTVNLMSLQKELKVLLKGFFEFRNAKAGTRIVSREMADYSAIRHYLDCQHLNYCTFLPKSEKPIKAVIRHSGRRLLERPSGVRLRHQYQANDFKENRMGRRNSSN